MNEKYLELLNQTLLTTMAKEINKRLAEENKNEIPATPEKVFENLPMLYDTVQEYAFGTDATGRSYRFMPKRFKAMVMRLIAPEYCPQIRITKNDVGVCAEAWLYLNNTDSKPVASGKQYVSYDAARKSAENDPKIDSTSDSDVFAYAEATAQGIALSKAYQEFGIGSWYTYQFEPEENPDAALAAMESNDGVQPTIAYGEDNDTANESDGGETAANNSETVSEPATDEPEQPETTKEDTKTSSESEVTDDTTPKKPESDSSDGAKQEVPTTNKGKTSKKADAALEAARARKAPFGKAADMNLTLGQTEERYPGNIFWMYNQPSISEEDKEAIKLIVKNNDALLELFNGRNVSVD